MTAARFLSRSHAFYQEWGALAKAESIISKYGDLVSLQSGVRKQGMRANEMGVSPLPSQSKKLSSDGLSPNLIDQKKFLLCEAFRVNLIE